MSASGVADIAPDSMERLGESIGDVVAITGQRRCSSGHLGLPGLPRKNLFLIDGIARETPGRS